MDLGHAGGGGGVARAVGAERLAIRLAQDANLTLLGFLRGDDATLYSHPERIVT